MAEVRGQLVRARLVVSAAAALLDPSEPPWLAGPEAAEVEFSRALVSALGEVGSGRSPEAAADVLRNIAIKLRG